MVSQGSRRPRVVLNLAHYVGTRTWGLHGRVRLHGSGEGCSGGPASSATPETTQTGVGPRGQTRPSIEGQGQGERKRQKQGSRAPTPANNNSWQPCNLLSLTLRHESQLQALASTDQFLLFLPAGPTSLLPNILQQTQQCSGRINRPRAHRPNPCAWYWARKS